MLEGVQIHLRNKIPPLADLAVLSIISWLMLGGAYLVFMRAVGFNVGFFPLLLQPLANNIGIISFFAPSGLGVRESVMVGYLVLAGIPTREAISIAVVCRLWFFAEEVFIFIVGLVVDRLLLTDEDRLPSEI
jgi:uncharacterized protein (TIRG00374 family)